MKVWEAIARALHEEGVGVVFEVLGDGNYAVLTGMETAYGTRLVHARHESGAVAMADAYSRATGDVGIASVTCGPGLTQIATSLMTARKHGSRMVVVAGDIARGAYSNPQYFDQGPFITAAGGILQPVSTAETAADDVRTAFILARRHDAPVVLNMPLDVQEEEFAFRQWVYRPSHEVAGVDDRGLVADPAALDALAELLASAQKPVIVLGAGASSPTVVRSARDVGDRVGALLATTLPAKGCCAADEFHCGIAGLFTPGVAARLYQDADVVLALGASLNYFTAEGGYIFPSAQLAQVDLKRDTWSPGGLLPDVRVRADAAAVLPALLARLDSRGVHHQGYRSPGVAAELAAWRRPAAPADAHPSPEAGEDPRALVEAIDPQLAEDTIVVVGSGHFWSFPICFLHRPTRFLFTIDFGSIGQALPMGIGAAVGAPDRPVVVFEGDSSMMMNIQELDTLARYSPDCLVVVMNDGLLGSEYHKARAKGWPLEQSVMGRADFKAIAEGFGVPAAHVHTASEMGEVFARWSATRGPMVVDAAVSTGVISPMYRKLYFGGEDE